jgi:hypothetical protein
MRLAKKAIRGIPAGHHWHNTAWYTKFSFDGGVHYSARTWPDSSSPKQYASSHPECPTPCAPAAPLETHHRDLHTNLSPNRIRPGIWCVSTRWRIRHWSAISREIPSRSARLYRSWRRIEPLGGDCGQRFESVGVASQSLLPAGVWSQLPLPHDPVLVQEQIGAAPLPALLYMNDATLGRPDLRSNRTAVATDATPEGVVRK